MENTVAMTAGKVARFELAPPRRFILPAILLALSERPGYGYGLLPVLEEFRFGRVDRPAVYRALAQLQRDGLVVSSSQNPKAGQARRVYRVTALGERVLRVWMGVIKEEHDHLHEVMRRYRATCTTDAVLAEIEGGWAGALGIAGSPVSSSSLVRRRRLVPVNADRDTEKQEPGKCTNNLSDRIRKTKNDAMAQPKRFRLVPDRSVLLIEARSSVGPLSFGATGIAGSLHATVVDGVLRSGSAVSGQIAIDVSGLSSGNRLYDAELRRRIDARRFPEATIDLRECSPSGPGTRYRLGGDLTFHGVTRSVQGTVNLAAVSDRRLVITAEQVVDVRDFAISSPTVLMLRIYPDARVTLHAEAEWDETG